MKDLKTTVFDRTRHIQPIAGIWAARAEERLAALTKPPGSLGRLEELAARLCAIQQTLEPRSFKRRVVVCAADHGLAAEGVSAYPADVTAQMVGNIANGGAAINALARAVDADVSIVDVGVAGLPCASGKAAGLFLRRVRDGTSNITRGAAMSEDEMLRAVIIGLEQADQAADEGFVLLGLGEMGIGNTTAASAITAALTGLPAVRVTGPGSGIDQAALARKVRVIEQALAINQPRADAPFEILQKVGGLEIAALCGACLGGAHRRVAVMVDGFIATAAAMLAVAVCPPVNDYLFAAHLSPEPGHLVQCEWLRQRPLLDLGMRLGEGTGAALAMNLVGAACAAFNEMATFASAGVSGRI